MRGIKKLQGGAGVKAVKRLVPSRIPASPNSFSWVPYMPASGNSRGLGLWHVVERINEDPKQLKTACGHNLNWSRMAPHIRTRYLCQRCRCFAFDIDMKPPWHGNRLDLNNP